MPFATEKSKNKQYDANHSYKTETMFPQNCFKLLKVLAFPPKFNEFSSSNLLILFTKTAFLGVKIPPSLRVESSIFSGVYITRLNGILS